MFFFHVRMFNFFFHEGRFSYALLNDVNYIFTNFLHFTYFLYIFVSIWENRYRTCPKDVSNDYVFHENQ